MVLTAALTLMLHEHLQLTMTGQEFSTWVGELMMRWAEGGWALRSYAPVMTEKVLFHILGGLEIRRDREGAGK